MARISQQQEDKVREEAEQFLRALEGTVHALGRHGKARVRYARGAQPWGTLVRDGQGGADLRLPAPPPLAASSLTRLMTGRVAASEDAAPETAPDPLGDWPSEATCSRLRGIADQAAFQLRYHRPKTHRKFQPDRGTARQLFDLLEGARCEGMGMRFWRGAADNVDAACALRFARAQDRQRRLGVAAETQEFSPTVLEAFAALVRAQVCDRPVPSAFAEPAAELAERLGPEFLARLAETAESQADFARVAREAMQFLQVPGTEQEQEAPDNDTIVDQDEGGERMSDLNEEWDVTEDDRERTQPDLEIQATKELEESGEGEGEEDEQDANLRRDLDDGEGSAGATESATGSGASYKVFTKRWDEVVSAAELAAPIEMSRHRDLLDRQLAHLDGTVQRLANRLHRRLLARQNRWWQFDLEEGLLDPGRLARVVVTPTTPLSFKCERESEFRDTVVTLLLDNSGSMRGRPITVAALSADILARTLERCSVKVEILGFTTVSWKGGQARTAWQEQGRPNLPGRLNDLRHIVYKPADVPFRRCRQNLGLMLRDGVLKENIDGEALLWAHERLLARSEQRRILMVISDGAPVDDSTLSTNPSDYLETHLKQVIEWIERRSPVDLLAIGIGHDVTRYYRRAVTISDAEDLGGVMIDELSALFDEDLRPAATSKQQARPHKAAA